MVIVMLQLVLLLALVTKVMTVIIVKIAPLVFTLMTKEIALLTKIAIKLT